jgi:hypothetical protein
MISSFASLGVALLKGRADSFPVEGETVVPPSSIVNLVVKVRYVHPGASAPAAVKKLPNGDAHHAAESEKEVEGVQGAAEKVVEKTLELVDSVQGDKEKERVWAKNGYAHAPYWPTVSTISSNSKILWRSEDPD